MKKFFFSLLAVVSVVCLTLTLSSCGSDDDDDSVNVDVVWAVDIDGDTSAPEEVKAESKAIGDKMEARAMQIYGGNPFKLPADKESLKPSVKTAHDARARFFDDSQITSLKDQLQAINTKYGKKYVYWVRISLTCEKGSLGSDKFDF